MYGALWRMLPGPWPVKTILAVLLAAVVVMVCFRWVFPWVALRLPIDDAGLRVLLPVRGG